MNKSKMIINGLFNMVNNKSDSLIDRIKVELILLFENEMSLLNIKYNRINKNNDNEILIKFNDDKDNSLNISNFYDVESDDRNERYLSIKKILYDFYNQINYIRKYKLITNKEYYSQYILNLTKKYIINNDFNAKNNKFINDEATRYIKKNKDVLLKYPILLLEYNIDTGDRKDICELYNDMIIYSEKYSDKEIYYEIINESLKFISNEDKKNLIEEYNKYDLIRFFDELKKYNNKNKYNNTNVNNLINYLEEDSDSSNIYKVIYGKE